MKIDRAQLRDIYNAALSNIRSTTVDRHESHEEHITRCWLDAVAAILKIDVAPPTKESIVIEPLD